MDIIGYIIPPQDLKQELLSIIIPAKCKSKTKKLFEKWFICSSYRLNVK